MVTTIDSLQIEINANAKNADKAVDSLISKLNKLTTSLKRVNKGGNASKGLGKVASASKTAKTNIDKTTNSVNKSAKSYNNLASAIGKFYATYFMAIRGLKGLWGSIESTADYIEAYNYFNVSLGKIGKDWSHQFAEYGYDNAEAYAESFSKRLEKSLSGLSGLNVTDFGDGTGLLEERGLKNLGLNIQEVTQYASQLASVTNSIGQTGEVSLATASAFTKLGADISSLFNIDYSTAMNNLQSGLIGQSRALYKYGIDITNATLQTYAYELGLEKAVSEMTQAEKMQLRMLAILEQSKVSWGDLANTINSPSNMIRQFKNNLKEAGMVLGQLFIPLLQKVLPIANGVTIALKRLLVSIANIMGVKLNFDDFGKGAGDFGDEIGEIDDGLGDIADSAKKAKAGLRGFDELTAINMPKSSGGGAGGLGDGIDLTDEILAATEEYERVWQEAFDKMESRAEKIADYFEKIFAPVKKLFKDVSVGDWFAVGGDVSNIASSLLNFLSRAIEKVNWEKVGNDIGRFLEGIDWYSVITSGLELKFDIAEAVAEVWFGSFEEAPIETALLTTLGVMKFTKVGNKVAGNIGLAITTAIIGQEIGKQIGETLFPEDAEWYDNFKWTGEEGFFATISSDLKSTNDAIQNMFTDWENNPGLSAMLALLFPGSAWAANKSQNTKDTFADLKEDFSSLKDKVTEVVSDLSLKLFTATSAIGNFKNKASENFDKLKAKMVESFSNMANSVVGSFNKVIGGIEKMINSGIDGVNALIEAINPLSGVLDFANIDITIDHVNLPKIPEIKAYSVGGFPEDGLFMANRGELVGKFSNGKTAVANNQQIVSGIEGGVKRAVAEVLAPYLADIAQSTREFADKDLIIDGDEMFKVNQRKAKQYTERTRRPAFA